MMMMVMIMMVMKMMMIMNNTNDKGDSGEDVGDEAVTGDCDRETMTTLMVVMEVVLTTVAMIVIYCEHWWVMLVLSPISTTY